ncbi:CHAP domain-containing protein [Streptococcus pluranimalium]
MRKSKVLTLLLLSSLVFSVADPAMAVTTMAENKTSESKEKTLDKIEESRTEAPLPFETQESIDNSNASSKDIRNPKEQTSTSETIVEVSTDTSEEVETTTNTSPEQVLPQSNKDSNEGLGESDKPEKSVKPTPTKVQDSKSNQISLEKPQYQNLSNDSGKADSNRKNIQANPTSVHSTIHQTITSDLSDLALMTSVITGDNYVEHWSGSDAYTHDLLAKRFGISSDQLDGFLKSTGINYDRNRFNGEKLLEWEKSSGLDVRAIIAIAIEESSLGTLGVASDNQANAFGFGAFDNNPNNAKHYNDEYAIKELTQVAIIQNKNNSFKRQDEKALQNAAGVLNVSKDGGVYYTDTSGTGKRRAKIMEDIDKWIDQHGGTPKAPKNLNRFVSSGAIVGQALPEFGMIKDMNLEKYSAATYPWGQCTWYVYNRAKELGYSFGPFMGNGGDWQYKLGYEKSHTPKVGAAVSFSPGQAGADRTYGHVAIVEAVNEDGSILITESNIVGLGKISFRTFSPTDASSLTYVFGQ